MKVYNRSQYTRIYPTINEKCETCGSQLEVFESQMFKTHLKKSSYKITAKACPKCFETIKEQQ